MSVVELYVNERRKLCGWLVRRGVNPADIDDILQDAAIRCLRAERRGQGVRAAYLWTAANSCMLDRLRAWRPMLSLDAPLSDAEPTIPDPCAAAADGTPELLGWTTLAPRQRHALVLRCQGYHLAEIAELLGASVEATKQLIRRARARLREYREAA